MDTRLTHWNINIKIEWIIQIINLTLTLISTLWITLLSEFGAEWGPLCIKSTDLTFFSMYSTSEGKWEFCTSNSVRSASSRQGGGSLGCRVGGSLRMRRILKQTHLSHFVAVLLFFFTLCFFFCLYRGSLASYRKNFSPLPHSLPHGWVWVGSRHRGKCLNLQQQERETWCYTEGILMIIHVPV